MSEVKEKFFASMDVREQSKKVYARQFSAFASWLERRGLLLSSVGREDILEYKDYLQTQVEVGSPAIKSLFGTVIIQKETLMLLIQVNMVG
jgi:hypothetical protein